MYRAHARDLIAELSDGAATAPARGREREGLGGHRIDEVDPPRVLPWIFWITARPLFPFALVVVAELLAIRQTPARLPHAILGRLAVLPSDPAGGSGERHELGTVLDRRRLLAAGPAPVGELE